MASLEKNLRRTLENTVKAARKIAEAGGLEAVNALAVGEKEAFAHMGLDEKALRNRLRARGRAAGDVRDASSGKQTVEHLVAIVAYEHWHRMLFARLLAENGLLLEPEHQVPVSLDDVEELARDEGMDVWELAGRYAEKMLPQIFRSDDPALEVDLARESRVKLERLLADLPRNVFTADDSLGWVYQFWQIDEKERVNKSGMKIGANELPAVTQLFTEDYMVEFLLHNTLGAWWAGKLGPIEAADEEGARAVASLDEMDGLGVTWTYLRFVQDKETKQWTPAAGTFEGWPEAAKEVTFLDPSMGSGHFLVFALPILTRMRMENEGLSPAEAIHAVLEDNLFGLEIDPRCAQIAAFNVALTAWKLAGWQQLPELHLACCGTAPRSRKEDWLELAEERPELRVSMGALFDLFAKAPVLGSLINPRADKVISYTKQLDEVQPLLEAALTQGTDDVAVHELAVTALGLAKAAEILAGQFTLVGTNVPYLVKGKQGDTLREFIDANYPRGKPDLAAAFLERCLQFTVLGGTYATVTPQNWLFLKSYHSLRKLLLTGQAWNHVSKLGSGAAATESWEVFRALSVISNEPPSHVCSMSGLDAPFPTDEAKAAHLLSGDLVFLEQSKQMGNPDCRIVLSESGGNVTLLSKYVRAFQGIATGDYSRFGRCFWEVSRLAKDWVVQQSTFARTTYYGGLQHILFWQEGKGELATSTQARVQGLEALTQVGVVVSQMRVLPVCLFTGDRFDNNVSAMVVSDPNHLAAVWAFCSSPTYNEEVRKIDQTLKVTNATLIKVPFDLTHWQKIAEEKYPNGLPKPFSSDPTQWLFNGHPDSSDQPLHVAVSRLLGYGWPRQTGSSFPGCSALDADGLSSLADSDGIVCLPALNREASAEQRLRALLGEALGSHDEHQLLKDAGARAKNLNDWLRDEFFEQHCKLFHHRPYVWHIWDGRADGFHALVNYHKLTAPNGGGYKLLESLTYSYLGDWIRRQRDDADHGIPGAEDRLIAGEALQNELKHILAGEPPYDLFVRWKPLHQQSIGWIPDINDGVRLNIRPFLSAKDVKKKGAGILRAKPNIKWAKDRGKEPLRPKEEYPWFWSWDEKTTDFMGGEEFDANRWNDLHYTNATKQAARDRKGTTS